MSQQMAGYLYSRNLVEVKASTTVSGTADTTNVDVSQFKSDGITLIFHCSAVAGAGSLAIVVQESDTSGSGHTSITGATITVAAAGVSTLFIPNVTKKYILLDQTLTGTSVTYSCLAYGQPAETTTDEGYSTAPVGQSGL